MQKSTASSILITLFVGFLIAGLQTACSGGSDAADTVEAYIEAKVAADEERIRQLLCSELEATYEAEAMTFAGVSDATIEGMACTQVEDNRVSCEGRIVALYGTEENEFPLTAYRVVQEGGEWKWCGEDY
jgi:hypothetical protein